MQLDYLVNKSNIWMQFYNISKIPRQSGYEKEVQEYIKKTLEGYGYKCILDSTYNLFVYPKNQNKETILLQSHVDMVCEKEKNKVHNFLKDPINWKIKENFLFADGTTLGADNGIGVAITISILKEGEFDNISALFTVSEEIGLAGINNLSEEIKNNIKKSTYCINLDNETENHICIGCACMQEHKINIKIEKEKPIFKNFFRIEMYGLSGGHSGIDIHKGLASAPKIFYDLMDSFQDFDIRLTFLDSGRDEIYNVILRDLCFGINTNIEEKELELKLEEFRQLKIQELIEADRSFNFTLKEEKDVNWVFSKTLNDKLLYYMKDLPFGMLNANRFYDHNVTMLSSNICFLKEKDDDFIIGISSRANKKYFADSYLKDLEKMTEEDILVTQYKDLPWEYKGESKLNSVIEEVYMFDVPDVKIAPIHAGVECRVLALINPDLQIVSLGPNIHNPHTPKEHVEIPSVESFYKRFQSILEKINE